MPIRAYYKVVLGNRECDTVSMPVESNTALMTAEELERVDIPGKWTELVRGRL